MFGHIFVANLLEKFEGKGLESARDFPSVWLIVRNCDDGARIISIRTIVENVIDRVGVNHPGSQLKDLRPPRTRILMGMRYAATRDAHGFSKKPSICSRVGAMLAFQSVNTRSF
jgi:hypothetical protein